MTRLSLLLPPLLMLLTLAGCAGASGPFPSLAPRPIEKALGEPGVPPVVAPVADDPEVAARVSAFIAQAQTGERDFRAALPAAEEAVRHAGAAGSDRWIQAQQAISRAEAAETPTTRALAELDRYATDRANAKPLSAGDLARMQAATAEVQRLSNAEHAEIARLQGALKNP
ncbi:MAG TPA: hypothetical protein VH331_02490 [Allosphingosinicella sp.]|jgi:hypothetical protein|nr:hypothetical protein [Allosphingosinicella sp.]